MKILILDDDAGIRETLKLHLSKPALKVTAYDGISSGRTAWREEKPDIVLLDLMLPDGDGISLLKEMSREDTNALVIMITGHQDMQYAIEATKSGAFNYIHKPIDIDELDAAVESAIRFIESAKESQSIASGMGYQPDQIVGRSRIILNIHKQIGLASRSRVNVLITGASGTGKELVAHAIHQYSTPREPFIAVNCSAIVSTLAEAELFGYEKGAFTGAHQSTTGKLELAGMGTFFLDEIGDLSAGLQAKLLRVIQERTFERVGGHQSRRFNARLIAATNKNLDSMCQEGRFREDLYFRLKVLEIHLPPLEERAEDIPDLVHYLLEKINRDIHRKVNRVPEEVVRQLQSYPWPGNIRELENVLTQAVVRSSGNVLSIEMPNRQTNSAPHSIAGSEPRTLTDLEKNHIEKVLQETQGNFGQACEILGISRPTLRKKIRDYGIRMDAEED